MLQAARREIYDVRNTNETTGNQQSPPKDLPHPLTNARQQATKKTAVTKSAIINTINLTFSFKEQVN